jgi:hypothetical protein
MIKKKERSLGQLSVEFRRRKFNNWWWTLLNGKLFYSTREIIIIEKRIIEFIIKKYEYEWNYPLEFIG